MVQTFIDEALTLSRDGQTFIDDGLTRLRNDCFILDAGQRIAGVALIIGTRPALSDGAPMQPGAFASVLLARAANAHARGARRFPLTASPKSRAPARWPRCRASMWCKEM